MKIPKKIHERELLNNGKKVGGINRGLKILEKEFLEENGKISNFLVLAHNKKITVGTFILPITEDGEIIYIEEFRVGVEEVVISFPVGGLEEGVSEVENCKKELREETGYYSDEIEYLGESIIENYVEGKAKYYIARNCKKIGEQELEIGENIDVFKVSIEEFEKMILDGKVGSSKTAYMFLLARKKGFI